MRAEVNDAALGAQADPVVIAAAVLSWAGRRDPRTEDPPNRYVVGRRFIASYVLFGVGEGVLNVLRLQAVTPQQLEAASDALTAAAGPGNLDVCATKNGPMPRSTWPAVRRCTGFLCGRCPGFVRVSAQPVRLFTPFALVSPCAPLLSL